MKLALCGQCILWMVGRTLLRRMLVKSMPGIDRVLCLYDYCKWKGSITLHLQVSGNSS